MDKLRACFPFIVSAAAAVFIAVVPTPSWQSCLIIAAILGHTLLIPQPTSAPTPVDNDIKEDLALIKRQLSGISLNRGLRK